jgi:hypothetical protein
VAYYILLYFTKSLTSISRERKDTNPLTDEGDLPARCLEEPTPTIPPVHPTSYRTYG